MKHSCILLVFALLTAAVYGSNSGFAAKAAAAHSTNALIELGKSTVPVQLDGRQSPGEWDDAVVLNGFSTTGNRGRVLGNKQGQLFIKRSATELFLAVRTVTLNDSPGGGLLNNTSTDDSLKILNDDTVELTFHSAADPDKIAQIICNPGGSRLDILRTLSSKHQNIKWDMPGLRLASKVESFYWVLEVKIPLDSLKISGGRFRFNIARNWCDSAEFSTLNKVQKYFQVRDMIEVVLAPQTPVVKQLSLGNPDDGSWNAETLLDNRSGREVVFVQMLHEYSFPKVNGKVRRQHKIHALDFAHVQPGRSCKLLSEYKGDSKNLLWLATMVWDAKSNRVLFRRLVQGRKSLSLGRRPVYAAGKVPGNGSFTVFDYPGYGYAAFFFKFGSRKFDKVIMKDESAGTATTFRIVRRPDGFCCRAAIPSTPGNYVFALPDGTQLCTVRRKNFPWLNNRLGKEKVVIPPFTPIAVENGCLKTIFREHKLNFFGLWDSIKSKETELLAQPMYFELISGSKKVSWQGKLKNITLNNHGHDAGYRAEAVSSCGITLAVDGNAEYDGFFWNRFKLENPRRLPIDRLTLCVPLKDREMPLFHVISNTIRTNPAGFLPAGDGEVWNGTQLVRQLHFGKAVMHDQMVPLVWLGGVEKGVCYFMDSSFGCRLSTTAPQVRISRRNGVLLLEADIINLRSNARCHQFEFGLQATPVKPVDPVLLPMTRDARGWVPAGLPNLGDFNQVRGGFASQWSSMPLNGDYSLYKRVIGIIEKGGEVSGNLRSEIEAFFKKHRAALNKGFDKDYPGHSAKIVKSALNCTSLTFAGRKPSLPIMYTDPRLVLRYEDAVEYFKSEWWNPARISYTGVYRSTLTPTLQDYLLYQHCKLLQCGLRGINLDDAYLMPDDNPETMAKVDEWGILHSNAGILQLRTLIKRLATMMHTQFKHSPRYIEPHMTNGMIIPAFAFADALLGFEQNYGETPRTRCFSEGEILATYTGRQLGAKVLGLPGLLRRTSTPDVWKKRFPALTRSNIALMAPFGITARTSIRQKYEHFDVATYHKFYQQLAEFKIAEKDCIFVPCFENKKLTASDKNIRIAYYQRQGRILACVANAGKTAVRVTLKLDGREISKTLTDWESKKVMQNHFTVAPDDFKLVCIE